MTWNEFSTLENFWNYDVLLQYNKKKINVISSYIDW